jgi:Protein of unknown function (DUF1566)
VSTWVACEGGSTSPAPAVGGSASGAAALVGGANDGGRASPAAGSPALSGQSSGGATSTGGTAAGTDTDGGAGGAAPAACGDDTPPNAWASWTLPDPTTTGQANSQSYTLTDEVATSDATKLEWQRHIPAQTFTWPEAKQYCGCLSLAGHDDWQLPSRMELVSIVDYTRQNPSLDASAFPETPFEWFWSASPKPGEPESHWYVAFFDGDTHASAADRDYRVRCVRRAPGQLPRYDASVSGTVKDLSTGLVWQREASALQLTWAEAKLACEGLPLAGGGWRVPNMAELQSIIDESKADPAIDAVAFPSTPSEGFWAATPLAGSTTAAWFVSFLEGIAYNALLEHPYRVRCVR